MEVIKIPYKETNHFSKLVLDYLANDPKLKSFINDFPSLDSFSTQITQKSFQNIDRIALHKVLKNQNLNPSKETLKNIDTIKDENTFSITTGHQLCLFTGPLYLIYKIASTINLVETLKVKFPENNFIPIFWLASEDHDFEEVSSINLFNKKIKWSTKQKGAVGKMNTTDVNVLIDQIKEVLGESGNSVDLISLFKKAYTNNNLAQATRIILNKLFGEYGLVIIDADSKVLKNKLIDIIKKDVLKSDLFNDINKISEEFSAHYKLQAKPREINFFRIKNNSRVRIDEKTSSNDIENNFFEYSPNVLLRPLYQELILPNLAYVGGGAEISYWMLLKQVFKNNNIVMPLLILRNSALIMTAKNQKKINQLAISSNELFNDIDLLKKQFTLRNNNNILLNDEINQLEEIYQRIKNKISDLSFQTSLESMKVKNIQMLSNTEKKIITHFKNRNIISLNKLEKIISLLFPENSLQERYDNFIPYYLNYGENFIKILVKELNPLDTNFVILNLEN